MTEAEVRLKLHEAGLPWEDFERWIEGQMVVHRRNGTKGYYPWDVRRFITDSGPRVPASLRSR